METTFGKYVKEIRGKESLRTMSAKLGVSPAFLSAMETGRKSIPPMYCKKISELYNLTEEQETKLYNSICETNGHVDISITEMNKDQQEMCMMFARKINSASEEEIEKIRKAFGIEVDEGI